MSTNNLGSVERSIEQSSAERNMSMALMADSPHSVANEAFGNADEQQVMVAAQEALNDDGFEDVSPMQAAITGRAGRHADPDWKTSAKAALENPESLTLVQEERIRGELDEMEHHQDRAMAQDAMEKGLEPFELERTHRKNVSESQRERQADQEERVRKGPEAWERDPRATLDEDQLGRVASAAETMWENDEFPPWVARDELEKALAAEVAYGGRDILGAGEAVRRRWQEEGRMYKKLDEIDPWTNYPDPEGVEETVEALQAETANGASLGEAVNAVTDDSYPDVGCEGWGDITADEKIPDRDADLEPRDIDWADDDVTVKVRVAELWDPNSRSQFQVGLVAPTDTTGVPENAMKVTIWQKSDPTWRTPDGEPRLRKGDVVVIKGARVNLYRGDATLAVDSKCTIEVQERGDGRSPDGDLDWDAHPELPDSEPVDEVSQNVGRMVMGQAGARLMWSREAPSESTVAWKNGDGEIVGIDDAEGDTGRDGNWFDENTDIENGGCAVKGCTFSGDTWRDLIGHVGGMVGNAEKSPFHRAHKHVEVLLEDRK